VHRSIILFFLLTIFSNLFALDAFIFRDNFTHANLQNYIYFTVDENRTLKATDILQDNIKTAKLHNGSLGYIKYPVWTKLSIKNESELIDSILLVNPKPSTDKLDIYIYKQNILLSKKTIGHSCASQWQNASSRYQFVELKINPHETIEVIAKIDSIKTMEASWMAVTKPLFMSFNTHDYLLWGVFGGFIMALVFYNISMYFSVKDTAYIAYIIHALGLLIFQYASNGILHETSIFSQKAIDTLSNTLPNFGAAAYLIFQVLFFDTKKNMPIIHKLLLAAIFINILICIVAVYESNFLYLYRIKLGGIFYLYMLTVSAAGCLIALKKRLDGALYYILGQGMFAILNAYHASPIFLKNEISFATTYAIVAGVLFDVIFLSLALSSRVRHMRREKDNKEKLLLSQSRFAAIGSVIGNISHQWKVPLVRMSALIMEIDAILYQSKNKFDSELKNITDNMKKCLSFMDESIKDFNNFYGSDTKKKDFRPADEIESVLQLLSAKTLFIKADIIRFIDNSIIINGHKSAFAHVCMILLDNALDAIKSNGKDGGVISVELFSNNGKDILLKIADNGGGINIKPIESIFDAFTSVKKTGGGIGLAIAKIIVEQKLNGSIKAYNDGNKAVFELRL